MAASVLIAHHFPLPPTPFAPVVLLVDDQDELLNSTHPHYMPALDKHLAQGGTRLSDFTVPTPVCCPARAALLTGQYPHCSNVTANFYPGGEQGRGFSRASCLPVWSSSCGVRACVSPTGHTRGARPTCIVLCVWLVWPWWNVDWRIRGYAVAEQLAPNLAPGPFIRAVCRAMGTITPAQRPCIMQLQGRPHTSPNIGGYVIYRIPVYIRHIRAHACRRLPEVCGAGLGQLLPTWVAAGRRVGLP